MKQELKRLLFAKPDVPDVYCMVKFGSSPAIWRTPTIKDNENPEWGANEYRDYVLESGNQVISIDVWYVLPLVVLVRLFPVAFVVML